MSGMNDTINHNPGPTRDPVRQQGRALTPRDFDSTDWYRTTQRRDRSRAVLERRVYHVSYQTSSGHTWDEHFEIAAKAAREIEEAGIDLGWGGVGREEINRDLDRRYWDGPSLGWLRAA